MIQAVEKFAKAMASAVVADLEAAPTLMAAIRAGQIDRQGLENIMFRDLTRDATGESGPVLFPYLRKLIRSQVDLDAGERSWGLGQWGDIAGAISAVSGAVIGYSVSKASISAQKSIKEAAESQIAANQRLLEAQANIERLAYEDAAQKQQAAVMGIDSGIPDWVLPVGIGVAATAAVALFLLSKKRK